MDPRIRIRIHTKMSRIRNKDYNQYEKRSHPINRNQKPAAKYTNNNIAVYQHHNAKKFRQQPKF